MLELYVWGQAFGLPSIDAECLATITYLHNALSSSEWQLIPSNDPSVSPSNQLPALHNDSAWTSGFAPIVDYLVSKSLCKDLDVDLQPSQKADCVAWSAYLNASAGPLLDVSLYVSAANWAATTRPALTALLPFPLTWTVPPLLRAEAIKRSSHLGLSELDSDFDPHSTFHLSTGREALPETFRRHIPAMTKKTVREEMTPEQSAAFRLWNLARDCLNPLNKFLTEGVEADKSPRFFRGTSVSSLDCLAYAYLSLMREAPVPRSFLKDWLECKTRPLSKFVNDMGTSCFTARGELPWAKPEQSTLLRTGTKIFDSMIRNMPSLGEHYATENRLLAERGTKGWDSRISLMMLGFVAVDVAAAVAFYSYRSLQPFGAHHQVWRSASDSGFGQFGELGSMLNHALGPMPTAPGNTSGLASSQSHFVETDTEVD